MKKEDTGYTSGYYGGGPSSQHEFGSLGWMGAKQREKEREDWIQSEQRKRWDGTGGIRSPRVAGEGLYKLLVLAVAGFVGWFGFTLATRMGLSSGFELAGLVTGAVGGWRFVHIFKSPLVTIFAVVETLIRWAFGIGIVIFLIWWLGQ